jgi:hypothetical protein
MDWVLDQARLGALPEVAMTMTMTMAVAVAMAMAMEDNPAQLTLLRQQGDRSRSCP